MCKCSVRIINRTSNGSLSYGIESNRYTLTFKNCMYEFLYEELMRFKLYVKKLNINYWKSQNMTTHNGKFIPIITGQINMILLFNTAEIHELKCLLSLKKAEFITKDEIEVTHHFN